jgi:hypothetical protein
VSAPRPLSPEAVRRARALAERELSADERRAYESTPMTDGEREGILALIRWFRRRYPTAAERLAYARRAYKRWAGAGDRSRSGGAAGGTP